MCVSVCACVQVCLCMCVSVCVRVHFTVFLRGVKVYGETILKVVGDKPQNLEWPGYGFFIEVPKGALSPGVTARVAVKVILQGDQFKLPDNSQLISPIYWIVSSEVFLKEVTVNIQHYADIRSEEQCSKLRFIVARCSQEVLPYTFREKEGLFNAHTQYGAIKVKRFSIFSQVCLEGTDLRITSLKFYKPKPNTRPLLVDYDFVVLYHHELFLMVHNYYSIINFLFTNNCFSSALVTKQLWEWGGVYVLFWCL